MIRLKCETCSGNLIREGNYLVCESCHNRYVIDVADDVNAVARATAWGALRNSDFERSAELFEELLLKNNKDHEAYWGLALAKASVIYVTDYEHGKKVPTCNNISDVSFLADKNVKSAIEFAPKEIAESYKAHAEYIEKVRKEWIQKASKEPPYDVFICFKDSDRENGVERTSDSIAAQDLYTALTDKGYKVFFSRVSLRGKVAENYEPYIYNAIKTAKVMIVYGEKAEYFSAPWLKNEWMRFKKRVDAGEKISRSLVVVYKGVDPYDIPTALTGGKQLIDLGIVSNYEILINHVKRIVEESKQGKKLDKVEIKGGQMGKKSSQLTTEVLKTKDLGRGFTVETSIDEKNQLALVKTYVKEKFWSGAKRVLDDLISNNFNLGEAIWYKFLVGYKSSSYEELIPQTARFKTKDYDLIAKALSCAEEGFAKELLPQLYDFASRVDEKVCVELLKVFLPYNFDQRSNLIDKAFEVVIEKNYSNAFDLLIATLKATEVDRYIDLNNKMAKANWLPTYAKKVLEVDEGNIDAYANLFKESLRSASLLIKSKSKSQACINKSIEYFEFYLKYSQNVQTQLAETFNYLISSINATDLAFIDFALRILKYCNGNFIPFKTELINLAFKMIENRHFKQAKDILENLSAQIKDEAKIFWGLCLIKAGATKNEDLVNTKLSIFEEPEFDKFLTLADSEKKQECINLKKYREVKIGVKNKLKVGHVLKLIGFLLSFFAIAASITYFIYYGSLSYKEQQSEFLIIAIIIVVISYSVCTALSASILFYSEDPNIWWCIGVVLPSILVYFLMPICWIVAICMMFVKGPYGFDDIDDFVKKKLEKQDRKSNN